MAGAVDGGGSIRIPAACNGLVGLKISRGLSPCGPQTGEPLFGMVAQGVISRTVRDTATAYDAIIGPNPRAAYRVALPDVLFADHIRKPPGTLKIGYSTSSAINPHPDPAELHRQVAETKQRIGAHDNNFEADTLAVSELARSGGVLAPMRALENRNNHIQSLAAFHESHDYFMTPTLATPPWWSVLRRHHTACSWWPGS